MQLSTDDIARIKANAGVGSALQNTFVSFGSGLARDVAVPPQPVAGVLSSNASRLAVFVNDTTAPSVQNFSLDLVNDQLRLTFTEPIQPSTLNFSYIQLHSAGRAPAQFNYRLSGGSLDPTTSQAGASVVIVQLTDADTRAIKPSPLASNVSTTYLSLDALAVRDMANVLSALTSHLQADSHVADTSRAQLIGYELDLDAPSTLTLTFSDVVSGPVRSVALRLQSAQTAILGRLVTLSSGTNTQGSGAVNNSQTVVLHLSDPDQLALKSTARLATGITDTYLTIRADFINDYLGRDIEPITDGEALQADNVTVDQTPPALQSFSLDNNAGLLNLTFSDFVDLDTLLASGIAIQNVLSSDRDSNDTLRLNASSRAVRSADGKTVTISLTYADQSSLKLRTDLGTRPSNTFVTIDGGAIVDLNGNNVSTVNSSFAFGTDNVAQDITGPRIRSYSLNRNTGQLTIVFDEVVQAGTFNPAAITIQAASNITGTTFPSLNLTGGTSTQVNSDTVTVQLSDSDLDRLKLISGLATNAGNTFISLASSLVSDMNNQSFQTVSLESGRGTPSVIRDSTSPSLQAYNFDLDSGIITLNFSEAIQPSDIDISQFVLISSTNTTVQNATSYRLQSANITAAGNNTFRVVLSRDDLNNIKALTQLASEPNSTFLTFSSRAVNDTSGVPIVPVNASVGLPALGFVGDSTDPRFNAFSLDMNQNQLTIDFTESIDTSNVQLDGITLLSAAINATINFTLSSNSSIISTNGPRLVIQLGPVDANAIKSQPGLAKSFANTFLSLTSGAVSDTAGNGINAFVQGAALASPNNYSVDTSSPALDTFSLSLQDGVLNLTFTEAVNVSTFNISSLVLRHSASVVDARLSHRLQSANVTAFASGSVLSLALSTADLNSIKSASPLARSPQQTYLTLDNNTVLDTVGNRVQPIQQPLARGVAGFTPDGQQPAVERFAFDLNTGFLTVYFSETINTSSINPAAFTLQSDVSLTPRSQHTLRSSSVLNTTQTTATIRLSPADLDAIKQLTSLGTSAANTFLSVGNQGAQDTSGNVLQTIPGDQARRTNTVTPDTTPPQLSLVHFNAHAGNITFYFDEVVDVTSLNFSQFFLQDASPANQSITLSGGVERLRAAANRSFVQLSLTAAELNEVYRLGICAAVNSCYIRIGPDAVQDMAGNLATEIADANATIATNHTFDRNIPQLQVFVRLDLDSGELVLSFTETMRISSLNATALTLQKVSQTSPDFYTLTGGSSESQDSTLISIMLLENDLNALKTNTRLCTDVTDCWVRFTSGLLRDMAGNPVEAVISRLDLVRTEMPQSIVADTTAASLREWHLDMENGQIRLVFNEPVETSTFQFSAITLLDNVTSSVSVPLTGATLLNTGVLTEFTFSLSASDLLRIKAADLASNINDSYIALASTLVRDSAEGLGNSFQALVDGSNATQAETYSFDVTSPSLTQFVSFDLNLGQLVVRFDEPVSDTSFLSEFFTLQSNAAGSGALNLTNATVEYVDIASKLDLRISLSDVDIRSVLTTSTLGTTNADTFVVVRAGGITDVSGRGIVASTPQGVRSFIRDSNQPDLLRFSLDMNTGLLSLTFDDIVSVSTLSTPELVLQASQSLALSYTLSSVTSGSPDGYVVDINLTSTDLNAIKARRGLAESQNTTFASLSASLIRDVSALTVNPITPDAALRASQFTNDTTLPILTAWEFNIDTNRLTLSFSETVDLNVFNISSLILQNSANISAATEWLRLTGGQFVNVAFNATSTPVLVLSDDDLNAVKAFVNLAHQNSSSYLSIADGAVTDMVGNQIVPVPDTNATLTRILSADRTSPSLRSYDFSLDNGIISLTFSETVNASSLSPQLFTFYSSPSLLATQNFQLRGGNISETDSPVINITLTREDLDEIKRRTALGTSNSSLYLSFTEGAIADTAKNPVSSIIAGQGRRPNTFIQDTTPPALEDFSLNMNTTTLTLTFSETVDSTSFRADQVTIQSAANVTGNPNAVSYTLTASTTTTSGNSSVLTIPLSQLDADAIKSLTGLASSSTNTFVSLTSRAVSDMASLQVDDVPQDSATGTAAQGFVRDTTAPRANNFSLDLDGSPLLTIQLSESVNMTALNLSQITIVGSGNTTYSLTGGVVESANGSTIRLRLSFADANEIKRITTLATSASDTFLSIGSGAILDTSGNNVVEAPAANPLSQRTYTGDRTPPRLDNFRLTMTNNVPPLQLVLSFSETVNVSTFRVEDVLIQLYPNDTALNTTAYRLTNATYSLRNTDTLVLNISAEDMAAIQALYPLASTPGQTFISIAPGSVIDIVSLPLQGINSSLAKAIERHTADLTRPRLISFSLNLTAQTLLLNFTEAMQATTFVPNRLTIHASRSSSAQFYILRGGIASVEGSTALLVNLSETDQNALKQSLSLAISNSSTYISIRDGVAQDLSNNLAHPILIADALPVAVFTADNTRPALRSFDFNVNTSVITLVFSETINISSFDPTGIVIQNSRSLAPNASYRLTGGNTTSINGPIVRLTLSDADQNAIKALRFLAVSANSTFITVDSRVVQDINRNILQSILGSQALAVTGYNLDTIEPRLVRWALNHNEERITLYFDETVIISTLEITNITLVDGNVTSVINFTLSSDSKTQSLDGAVINIDLSLSDHNEIKRLPLCTSPSDCFLTILPASVQDAEGRELVGIFVENALPVFNFTFDTTSVHLQEFSSFDLSTGVISLSFSETVNTSSIIYANITLLELFETPVRRYSLTSGTASGDSHIVNITLSPTDLGAIKSDPYLCTRRGNCYISIGGRAVRDMNGQPSVPVSETHPGFIVQRFIADRTPPSLDGWVLDLESNTLTLEFSEVVDPASLRSTGIRIQSTNDSTTSDFHRLSPLSTTSSQVGRFIVVNLTAADVRALQASTYAKNINDSFVALDQNAILDTAFIPNGVNAVSNVALSADGYVADTTAPRLNSFHLDLATNVVVMTFNEPVDFDSLNASLLTFHASSSPDSANVTLTGGTVTANADRTIVTLALLQSDIAVLKLDTRVATERNNTYLTLLPGSIPDTAGNLISEVLRRSAAVYTSDSSRLQLLSYSIDMATGDVNLTFSDVALLSTLDLSKLTLQDSRSANFTYTLKTSAAVPGATSGQILRVRISAADLVALQRVGRIANSQVDTFLTFTAEFVDDTSFVDVVAITNGNALQVRDYRPDLTPPSLQDIIVNLTSGQIQLVFSKPVDASTLDFTQVRLQNSANATNASIYSLTSGSANASVDGLRVTVTITQGDLDAVKLIGDLFTNASNSFISLVDGSIRDLAGNNVSGTPEGEAVGATPAGFTDDQAPIQLLAYQLDLDGVPSLTLNFSEVPDFATFNLSAITLQSAANSSAAQFIYRLTGGVLNPGQSSSVRFNLSDADADAIKIATNLGNSPLDTFVSVLSGLVRDINSNPTQGIPGSAAIPAAGVADDNTEPNLRSAVLDLNTGTLQLSFSEAVEVGALFNISHLQLQSLSDSLANGSILFTFRNVSLPANASRVINITIGAGDLERLALLPGIGSLLNNTFVSLSSGLAVDTSRNVVRSQSAADALQVQDHVADGSPPLLQNFAYDRATDTLVMTFSEAINASAIRTDRIALQNSFGNVSRYLTGASQVVSPSGRVVRIRLADVDRDAIRTNPSLIRDLASGSVTLNLSSSAVEDMYNNPSVDTLTPVRASSVVNDTSDPTLDSYSLDLSNNTLTLTFSETIDSAQVNVSLIQLLSSNDTGTAIAYSLSSSTIISQSASSVVISLSREDRDQIKGNGGLASSNATTFVSVLAGAVVDTNGNPSTAVLTPQPVRIFTPDTSSPSISGFDLDMNTGTLLLTYDDTVLGSSVNPRTLTISDGTGNVNFTLTGARFITQNSSSVVTIRLSQNDFDALKARPTLAASPASTLLSASTQSATDSGNNTALSRSAISPTGFSNDTSRPELTSFTLSLQNSSLTLTFSEFVNTSTLRVSDILLHSLANSTLGSRFSLSGAQRIVINGSEVVISLLASDVHNITFLDQLCTAPGNCFISHTSTLVQDASGLSVLAHTSNNSLGSRDVVQDDVRPSLVSFIEFDLDSGRLALSFSEVMNVSTLQGFNARLQTRPGIPARGQETSLLDATAVTVDGTVVVLQLSSTTLNIIKSSQTLCTSSFDCLLRFTADFLQDMSGNQVVPISDAGTSITGQFPDRALSPDVSGPVLDSFDLDMQNGVLNITFDEIVERFSVTPTALTLRAGFNSSISYTLANADPSSITRSGNPVFSIRLSQSDLNRIKATPGLVANLNSTYLTYTSSLAVDTSNLQAQPAVNGNNSLRARILVSDSISPSLIEFTAINLGPSTIQLKFSEPVDTTSVDYSRITLLSSSDPTTAVAINLTGGTARLLSTDLTVLEIDLAEADLLRIKLESRLAVSTVTSNIQLLEGAVRDVAGNNVSASSILEVLFYGQDAQAPSLSEFSLDMDVGLLNLTFDDVVLGSTMRITDVTLHSSATLPASSSYQLRGGSNEATRSFSVSIQLTDTDIYELKRRLGLAKSVNNTYITMPASTITDYGAIGSAGVLTPKQITRYFPDTTRPTLNAYELSIATASIQLDFSEVLDLGTFDMSQVTLQSVRNTSTAEVFESYSLTSASSVNFTGRTRAILRIGAIDLHRITQRTLLAIANTSTYLSINEGAVRDTAGNPIIPINATDALQVVALRANLEAPLLLNFTFDANSSQIILSFSESVDLSNFSPTQLTLQDTANVSSALSPYTLTGGTVLFDGKSLGFAGSAVVTIALSDTDDDYLKQNFALAQSQGTSYLVTARANITDFEGQQFVGAPNTSAVPATTFVADSSGPRVTRYSFDRNTGALTLVLDELLLNGTFNPAGILLLNSSTSPQASYNFSGTSFTVANRTVTLQLSDSQLSNLRSEFNVGSSAGETFLSIASSTAQDLLKNPASVITPSNALPVTNYTRDSVDPSLSQFSLDVNAGVLNLTFSEPMAVDTLNLSRLVLQGTSGGQPSLTLLSSVITTSNGAVVSIQLSQADLNRLKAERNLASNSSNLFLSSLETAIRDTGGNALPIVTGFNVTRFTPDSVAPQFLSFDVVFVNATQPVHIIFHFSETIDVNTIRLDQVDFQDNYTARVLAYTLRSTTLPTQNSANIDITISDADLAIFRLQPPLLNTPNSTFISFGADSFKDMVGLSVPEILITNATRVDVHNIEIVQPILQGFDMNLNTSTIALYYDEEVLARTFDPMQLVIQMTINGGASNFTFNASMATNFNTTTLQVAIAVSDMDGLLSRFSLAVNSTTTYLSAGEGLASDVYLNKAVPRLANAALPVTEYTPRTGTLRLVRFTFNLNGQDPLELLFSDVINIGTFNFSRIVLQNSTNPPFLTFSIQNATISTGNSTLVRVFLSAAEKTRLKRLSGIANTPNNTFVSFIGTIASDIRGRPVANITSAAAYRADSVVPDQEPPRIERFNLNLNTGILEIFFDETVKTSRLDITRFRFQNAAPSSLATYDLVSSNSSDPDDVSSITIRLSAADLNGVKKELLCLSREDCYLRYFNGSISDVFGLTTSTLPDSSAIKVSEFVADMQPPTLLRFAEFNNDNGTLTLAFSESINASSLRAPYFQLQSFSHAPYQALNLSTATAVISGNSENLVLQLSDADHAIVRRFTHLCATRGTCYISALNNSAYDMAGFPTGPIPSDRALALERYVADLRAPKLDSFSLNLENGTLVLQFSEPIDVSSFRASDLSLFEGRDATSASHTLSSSSVMTTIDQSAVTVQLSAADVQRLRSLGIGRAPGTAFITLPGGAVYDLARTPNALSAINLTQAVGVGAGVLTPDSKVPTLNNYTLDMRRDRIVLTFSEPVLLSSFNATQLTLSGTDDQNRTINYTLTGGQLSPSDVLASNEITISLNTADTVTIKLNATLGVSSDTSFLTVGDRFAQDAAGLLVPAAVQRPVDTFIIDNTNPVLANFSINMNIGVMNLTFSDVVVASTFNAQSFRLQTGPQSTAGGTYTLTTASRVISSDGYVVSVSLGTDLQAIKAIPSLATTPGTTYLAASATGIDDPLNLDVIAITDGKAIKTANLVSDNLAPTLRDFTIDMNSGSLNLTFSDTVDLNSVNTSAITLLSAGGAESYTLTNSTVTVNVDGTVTLVTLSQHDLNAIKALPNLGISENTTYITFTSGLLRDIAGNAVRAVDNTTTVAAVGFTRDSTPPSLDAFQLNVNDSTVTFFFSETINASSFNISLFVLQNARNRSAATSTLRLDATSPIVENQASFTVQLTRDVFLALQRQVALGTSIDDTFLSVLAGSVSDMAGLPLAEVPQSRALPVTTVTDDDIAPSLLSFSLDLTGAFINLTFSESINASSILASEFRLQSSNASTSVLYMLNGGTVATLDATTLQLRLTAGDANAIKLLTDQGLATSASSTYAWFTEFFASDNAKNPIESIPASDPRQAGEFLPDNKLPELSTWSLDLDAGTVNVTFDETIRSSSVLLQQLSIDNGLGRSVAIGAGSRITSTSDPVVQIVLDNATISALKLATNLGTSVADSFLRLERSAVADMSGNRFLGLRQSVPASIYTADIQSPRLLSASLNLTSEEIVLVFDEEVLVSSLLGVGLTIQSASNGTDPLARSVQFSTSVSSNSQNGRRVVLNLPRSDLDLIKAQASLGVSQNSSFLSFVSSLITDMSGNNVTAVPPSAGVRIDSFAPDTLSPTVIGKCTNRCAAVYTCNLVAMCVACACDTGVAGVGA